MTAEDRRPEMADTDRPTDICSAPSDCDREHVFAHFAAATAVPSEEPGLDGAGLITAERTRQIDQEGYTAEHDAEHGEIEFARAAIAYLLPAGEAQRFWPWDYEAWKPKDRLSNLVRAGALVAAAIDARRGQEVRDGE